MFNKKHLIDRTVLFILAGRVINSLGGLITIYFVLQFLSDKSQGNYYTFLNLIGFSVFLEFGLSTLIIQFVSHNIQDTSFQKNLLVGPVISVSRFLILAKSILLHASLLSIVMGLLLGILGALLMNHASTLYMPWLLLVLVSCLSFLINTTMNVIEGTGKINDVAIARIFCTLTSLPALWICLSTGLGVYALVIQAAINALTLSIWLCLKYGEFIQQIFNQDYSKKEFSDYLKSAVPLQKKLSISFLSNYMSAQVYVPLMFALGQVELAGKFGATLQAFNAINGFAITWINAKFALFAASISKGERLKVYSEIKGLFGTSVLVLLSLIFMFWLLILGLSKTHSPFLSRFLELKYIVLFTVSSIAIHVYTSINTYLLSFKQDPLFKLNLLRITFLLIAISYIFTFKQIAYIFDVYVINSLAIGMMGAIYILYQFNTKTFKKE